MTPVIVCTHGKSAQALVDSAEMICGKQENCLTIPFVMGESLDELKENLENAIKESENLPICLTDLKGGTPFNTLVSLYAKYPKMNIITGVNIPMLLQLFVYREQLSGTDLIDSVIEAGKNGVFKYQFNTEVDDDF